MKKLEKINKERIKKLERLSLYYDWLDRDASEQYIDTFDAYLKIYNFRNSKNKKPKIQEPKIEEPKEKVVYDIPEELKKIKTETILKCYKNRNRYTYWEDDYNHSGLVYIKDEKYEEGLIKYILDNREHVQKKKYKKAKYKKKLKYSKYGKE